MRLKPRNRIVVFRLTEEEYECLKSACSLSGGRTLSDYTRSELLSIVHSNSPEGVIGRQVSEINEKLTDLHTLLNKLVKLLPARSLNGESNFESDVERPEALKDVVGENT